MSTHNENTIYNTLAIQRLVSCYCDAVHRLDAASCGKLFTPDGSIKIADYPEFRGQEAITAAMAKTFSKFSFIHQRCDTGLIDIDGDEARSRLAVFESSHRQGDEGVQIIYGTYEDEYRLLDEGWRFYQRRYSIQATGQATVKDFQVFGVAPASFEFLP